MHPVIRIISFLLLSGFVVFGGLYELTVGILIVSGVVLIKKFQSFEMSLRIIKRMKWFFLSILVVYLWFTPGTPLLGIELPGMPTFEGVRTGLLRVMSLVLVIFAVNYFVSSIARTKLVEAINWLLYPVNWLGIDNRTVALRIALVLELIPKVQHIVLNVRQDFESRSLTHSNEKRGLRNNIVWTKLATASGVVEQLFLKVVDEAINMPQEQITLGEASDPPVLQWLFPITLVFLFVWVRTL